MDGQRLYDQRFIDLYQELAAEDVSLAEMGIADYARLLEEADRVVAADVPGKVVKYRIGSIGS